jgi:vancomycin permeability regulator SanA
MFFILSKTLYYLMMPLVWVLGILLFARLTRNERLRKRLLTLGIGLVWLLGNNFLVNEALLLWEIPPTPMSRVGSYDVAIVLTGITNSTKQPRDRAYFEKGADRITHALQLYKMGKVKKILISGGSGSLNGQQGSEAASCA